ncbi:helix-hairpin-helix domain-containing protein [Kitasatospora sp. NPDC004240]
MSALFPASAQEAERLLEASPEASREPSPEAPPDAGVPGPGPPARTRAEEAGASGAGAVRARLGSAAALDRRAVAGLAVLLLIALAYAVQHFWLGRPQPVQVPEPRADPAGVVIAAPSPSATGAGPETVVVDVAGKVPSPGVRSLPGGSRVADALRAAGGALPGAETKGLNLARVLTDGEQVLVGESAPPAPGPAPGSGVPPQPISLNRATLEQLDALPGLGPTLARRIIAHRDSHGPFRSLEQLRQVGGIGERTYADIRPLLVL